jgi:DNA-binding NarL/FixJ family response regulator
VKPTKVKNATHIFIVDSNKLFVSLMGYIFTKNEQFEFTEFQSGEECLNNLHRKPSVIILDFDLPGMNGYDTLLEIKEQFPSAYVIALLGATSKRTPSEMFNAGVDDIMMREENNFVSKLIEKTENVLVKKQKPSVKKLRVKKLYYYILIIMLITAGIYYYQ